MDLFKKLKLNKGVIIKTAGLVIAGGVAIALIASVIKISFSSLRSPSPASYQTAGLSAPSLGIAEKSYDSYAYEETGLSARNIASSQIIPPESDYTPGSDAEDYEVTEYGARIETRRLDDSCDSIEKLKPKDYVIFERADKYEHGCDYRFKVKKANVEEVLEFIKGLDPRELSENVYTIKKLVDDFTSEIDILSAKKESIDGTLEHAIESYNELSQMATQARDVASLTTILANKLQIIQQLTQEQISINAQLERLARSKAEQLDRLDYTYFNVNVYESKYIDGDHIKDTWKAAVRAFVDDLNNILQGISIGLVSLILFVIQYILYLLLAIIAAKYVWKAIKYIWKK